MESYTQIGDQQKKIEYQEVSISGFLNKFSAKR